VPDSTGKSFPNIATSIWAVLVVLAITFVFAAASAVNATTVGFAYLISVFVIAASWGLVPSLAASFTATACFNYFFLPPVRSFRITEPENAVALVAFIISSIIASQLSDREKRRALEAMHRQAEMEQLYVLSRSLMLMDASELESHIAFEVD
jgi:two-component system sensor histidine kinase KdpD